MKVLEFTCRGERFEVDSDGRIRRPELRFREYRKFSNEWKFLGGMHHHWCNHITRRFIEAWENPEILNGCLAADRDHGTVRVWGGRYLGGLPRIRNARIAETE